MYIIGKEEAVAEKKNYTIRINPDKIDREIYIKDSDTVFFIQIDNRGMNDVSDLNIDYNSDVFLVSPESIGVVRANQSLEFNLTLKNVSRNAPIHEIVYFEYGINSISLPSNSLIL